ncbi:MAG: GNAT family N-acetyltransferase [Nevskia sp.]|nr:GNAT family N-acetyltransferase [Nevskia sp.]
MALIVGSLDKAVHDQTAFDCGEPPLNDFFKTKAAKHQAQRVSRTFVLTHSDAPGRVLGYYSLSNSQIAGEQLSEDEAKTLPRHAVPAVMLARLAVDRSQQGKRYGQWLLMDAIKRCALVGQQSGVYALLVDAKNDTAKRFYERFGFTAIVGHPMTLYLPLETGLKALQMAQG